MSSSHRHTTRTESRLSECEPPCTSLLATLAASPGLGKAFFIPFSRLLLSFGLGETRHMKFSRAAWCQMLALFLGHVRRHAKSRREAHHTQSNDGFLGRRGPDLPHPLFFRIHKVLTLEHEDPGCKTAAWLLVMRWRSNRGCD